MLFRSNFYNSYILDRRQHDKLGKRMESHEEKKNKNREKSPAKDQTKLHTFTKKDRGWSIYFCGRGGGVSEVMKRKRKQKGNYRDARRERTGVQELKKRKKNNNESKCEGDSCHEIK